MALAHAAAGQVQLGDDEDREARRAAVIAEMDSRHVRAACHKERAAACAARLAWQRHGFRLAWQPQVALAAFAPERSCAFDPQEEKSRAARKHAKRAADRLRKAAALLIEHVQSHEPPPLFSCGQCLWPLVAAYICYFALHTGLSITGGLPRDSLAVAESWKDCDLVWYQVKPGLSFVDTVEQVAEQLSSPLCQEVWP